MAELTPCSDTMFRTPCSAMFQAPCSLPPYPGLNSSPAPATLLHTVGRSCNKLLQSVEQSGSSGLTAPNRPPRKPWRLVRDRCMSKMGVRVRLIWSASTLQRTMSERYVSFRASKNLLRVAFPACDARCAQARLRFSAATAARDGFSRSRLIREPAFLKIKLPFNFRTLPCNCSY